MMVINAESVYKSFLSHSQALNRGNALSEQVEKLGEDIEAHNKTKDGSPKQLTKRITELGDVSLKF